MLAGIRQLNAGALGFPGAGGRMAGQLEGGGQGLTGGFGKGDLARGARSQVQVQGQGGRRDRGRALGRRS